MIDRLVDNVARVRERIATACAAAGRRADEVRLVAVTKYVDAATTRALLAAGCADLGESRPQSLWEKAAQLAEDRTASGEPPRWHLVGHLQRNKVERTVALAELIHSVDSVRLLQAIDAAAAAQGRHCRVLLEVNISGEAAKHGFRPEELPALEAAIAAARHVTVQGLMGMSGLESNAEQSRREFASLRLLRDELQARWAALGEASGKSADSPSPEPQPVGPRPLGPCCPLTELSMGMSDDFEAAIAEGATLVRIGSLLFE